jgi:hypothetical protein
LRRPSLCVDGYHHRDSNELNIHSLVISPAKNLETLTLKFIHSTFRSPTKGEPNLSALLELLSAAFSGIGRSDQGSLNKLVTIDIEMHNIPERCLGEEGVKEDQEMWDLLDSVLSGEGGYLRIEMVLDGLLIDILVQSLDVF